ncbi:DNA gyrase inhibitor YacG [Thermithiobacillus plumbiphilus]|uniref:DNA gyrase inhibitor YacG n=1 Tax=Thermithiobacillus plumbiphilus TaxID=1729899 RepID=A0ABU9D8R9_9PROT
MEKARGKPVRRLCPRCRQPAIWEGNPYRPFCSERCRLIDLGAWASEDYRVPSTETAQPPYEEDT